MWGHLETAKNAGNQFKSKLDRKKNPLAHWFENVRGTATGACLALALASGLTGCNTVQYAANYDQLQSEARLIGSMSIEDMDQFIQKRGVEQPNDVMPKVTVAEFSQKLSDAREFPYDTPVQIENPFVEGQYFQVLNGSKLGDHLKLIMDQGLNVSEWVASAGGNSYVVNPDMPITRMASGMNSFHDTDRSSTIVIGDSVSHDWDAGRATPENAAFILNHEMAHAHTTQEWASLGFSDSLGDALYNPNLPTFNESHADITAAITTNKHSDLSPESFLERLDNLEAFSNLKAINKANGDGTTDHLYRPQKAIEVLREITKADPDFLKNLPDSQIPIFAYVLVQESGYYHNMSEVLMSKYSDLEESRPSAISDAQFIKDVSVSYDDPQLNKDGDRLAQIWNEIQANRSVHFYKNALNDVVNDQSNPIPVQNLKSLEGGFESLGGDFKDLSRLIESHIKIAESDGDPRLIQHQLSALSSDVFKVADQMPSVEELKQERLDLVSSMKDRISEMGNDQLLSDPYGPLAKGKSAGISLPDLAEAMINKAQPTSFDDRSEKQEQVAKTVFLDGIQNDLLHIQKGSNYDFN